MAVVLLIDDDDDVHQIISLFLEIDGHTVLNAFDAESGLAIAKTDKPDLILLDLAMPVIDGIQALSLLKKSSDTKEIPVIILTAQNPENMNDDKYSYCADYLQKPIIKDVLLKSINSVLYKEVDS